MKNNCLGIYIHVPFCAAKCSYCDFYSLAGHTQDMGAYVRRLTEHIAHAALDCTDDTIDTIYFGGGTPSLLGGENIARILDTIRQFYHIDTNAEITVEANPDSMTQAFLSGCHAAGVNRLSMGIQSAHDDELQALGRIHTFAQAQDAFSRARAAGFDNISVDLMYALPGQSIERLSQSIDALLALKPEHLSCYGLTVEPHTPLGRQNPVLPDEDTQADMYLLLCEKMAQAGFVHYEISNFACDTQHRSRHNSRYWAQSSYLGFGPGAHADFNGQRMEWPRDFTAWLAGNSRPVIEDDDIDRALEYIMLSLRTSHGWDAAHYHTVFHRDPHPIEQTLAGLPKTLIHHTGTHWHLTDAGFLISNSIILAALDAAQTQ